MRTKGSPGRLENYNKGLKWKVGRLTPKDDEWGAGWGPHLEGQCSPW